MNYLYLQFVNLRVWLLRRHLRKMGFSAIAQQTSARTLLHLPKAHFEQEKLILDWIKVVLTAFAIVSMWLIFWLRAIEPIVVVLPPPPKTAVPPTPASHLPRSQETDSSPFYYVL